MLFGLLDLPVWGYVLITLILTHITIASVTIFLHRHQAHKALDLHPIVSHFFRLWLWLSTGMQTKEWVAVHRKHHAKCETVDDPHSPHFAGINKVLWGGVTLYHAEAKKKETTNVYGKGTPNDWMERNVYSRHTLLGTVLMLLINLMLFGVVGIAIWAIQMIWIPFWAAGVINGIGHYWGYRNYECKDASTNIIPIGLLIGGEELHNNHHTFPGSAKLSSKWWEFDIGYMYIRLMEMVGLAKVKKVAPKLVTSPAKRKVDMDTLRAVLSNRYHISSRYSKDVILRVLRKELRENTVQDRQLYKKAKSLLIREESLLDDESKRHLDKVLSNSQMLHIVYSFRQRLQEVWK